MGGNDLDVVMEFLETQTAGNDQPAENNKMECDNNHADQEEELFPPPENMETDPPVEKITVPEDPTPYTDAELAKVNSFEACLAVLCNGYSQIKIAQIRELCKTMSGTLDFITHASQKVFGIQVSCYDMFHIFKSPSSWADIEQEEPDEEKPWMLSVENDKFEDFFFHGNMKEAYYDCLRLFPKMKTTMTIDVQNMDGLWKNECDTLFITNSSHKVKATEHHVERILQNFPYLEKVVFETEVEVSFALFYELYAVNFLWFTKANWITKLDLECMTNEELHIGENTLTDDDINNYIKCWQKSANKSLKFKQLSVNYDREPTDNLWKGLDAKPVPSISSKLYSMVSRSPKPISHMVIDEKIFMEVRSGSIQATIMFGKHTMNRKLYFLINQLFERPEKLKSNVNSKRSK